MNSQNNTYPDIKKFQDAYVARAIGLANGSIKPTRRVVDDINQHADKFIENCFNLIKCDIDPEAKQKYGYIFLPRQHPEFKYVMSTDNAIHVAEALADMDRFITPVGSDVKMIVHDWDSMALIRTPNAFIDRVQDLLAKKLTQYFYSDVSEPINRKVDVHMVLRVMKEFPITRINIRM